MLMSVVLYSCLHLCAACLEADGPSLGGGE